VGQSSQVLDSNCKREYRSMTAAPSLADLLPPLSTEEFTALKADIKEHGVLHKVFVDEDGEVLDGRHRLKIDPNAPRKVIRGLSAAEKQAFTLRCNFVRRNLSPDQKRDALVKMKAVALALREEDPKKWTQQAVARELGRSRQTVALWFADARSKASSGNASKNTPDARVKVSGSAKRAIAERVGHGEAQAQVAADFGVSQRTVSTIASRERKQADARKQRADIAKEITGNCGVIEGDFRTEGAKIADDSVDLIFTDPPYTADAMPIWRDFAIFGERVLRPGGWLLAYTGIMFLPTALDALRIEGLNYGWTFAVIHSGGDARVHKLRLQGGWKPIVAMFKPPLSTAWDYFRDVISGGKEKGLHEWQQSEVEARYFIDRLSSPDGFVCDPFAGSGTSLAAAKSAGRRYIGFEINPDHVLSSRVRLSASSNLSRKTEQGG
jgi:ParB-like chromosome segregation protein Spo0J